MNNLHYYTFLVQNIINTRQKIANIPSSLVGLAEEERNRFLEQVIEVCVEELLNGYEGLAELYFSLEEEIDLVLKNRIVNLHKIEMEQLFKHHEEKLTKKEGGSEYCFILKFLGK